MSESHLEPSPQPLSSPFRNFTFETYPILQNLHEKLSNCGHDFVTLLNDQTLEQIEIPLFCDNRVCLNPDCKKHRLYKFQRAHSEQIKDLNESMRKPKGWIFSNPRRAYPVDKSYCQERLRKLYKVLDKSQHFKYGSNSKYSVHMEIKPSENSWYLHFHVASGGITNLQFVRRLWGYQVLYEEAISPVDLGYYISKYASKVPNFPDKNAFLEYALTTYKLQMHRFNSEAIPLLRESHWTIIAEGYHSETSTFFELELWLNKYLNEHGGGKDVKIVREPFKSKDWRTADRVYNEEILHLVYPSDVPDCVTLNLNDNRIKRG